MPPSANSRSILSSWPWNPNAPEDLRETEIYTRHFGYNEPVEIEIPRPMEGFTWTGVRVHTTHHNPTYLPLPLNATIFPIGQHNHEQVIQIREDAWCMLPVVVVEANRRVRLMLNIPSNAPHTRVELLAQRM